MLSSRDALADLRGLAAAQANVVSREQALGHGLSDRVIARLVDQAQWRRLAPGVFSTVDLEAPFLSRAWAGVLLGGQGSRIGGSAAARLEGLQDTDPDRVTVLVPHTRQPRPHPGWEFRRERPGVRSSRSVGDPPRTTVEDTVLDLCAEARPEDVVGWVTSAVQRRRTTPVRLRVAISTRARVPHRALLESLLTDVADGAESPIEVLYLRDVERAHGLPDGKRQQPTARRRGWRDVLYLEHGVVVELDGRLGHVGLGRFRDMDRDNLALVDGLLSLRYGSADLVGRPCQVAHQVGRVLQRRGWDGTPTRCRRCISVPETDWV